MNRILMVIIGLLFIVSCNSSQQKQAEIAASEDKGDSAKNLEDESEGESLESIIKSVTDEYSIKVKLDSTFVIGADTFLVKFEHYCLLDSGITIRTPYTDIYKLDSFVAHNFASNLTILKNGETLLTKKITKKSFTGKTEPSLTNLGALSYCCFELSRSNFLFKYSLSIPLTDVGRGVACKVDLNGDIQFEER